MRIASISFAIATLLLASCSESLSTYTSSVQRNGNFTEEQVRQIQFYISDDIILQRDLSAASTTISGGTVKMVNGREVEEVVIPAGTPGVVVGSAGSILHVSFDASGQFLRFGPNPGAGGKYTVMAYDWQGSVGYVMYGDQQFRLVPYGQYAHLLLDMERYDQVTKSTKEVSGRTLSP